jgi:hypothetical protein
VPLCWIQYEWNGNGRLANSIASNPAPFQCRINVRKDGIWGKGAWGVTPNIPVMHYTVFNVRAADG